MMKPAKLHLALGALTMVALGLPTMATAKDYTVSIDNMAYSKLPANLKVGDTITWVNQDTVPHTVTARDKSFNLAVDHGAHVKMTLSNAGSFPFYCLYHPMMRGTLKVEK